MNIPNAKVAVEIINIAGSRLGFKGSSSVTNFDVKAKLEETDRRSQIVIVNFKLLLNTKPSIVKFEVDGTATLTGKDEEINKMLEVDPEIKVPYVFQKIYQNAFAAMYLLATILKSPAPPHNLLLHQREGMAREDVEVESRVGAAASIRQIGDAREDMGTMERVESKTQETMAEKGIEERDGGSSSVENVGSGARQSAPAEHAKEGSEGLTNTED